MLLDHLSQAHLYSSLNLNVQKALGWLLEHQSELASMPNGNYVIDGDSVYALVNSYDTKESALCVWEGHREYADIHYTVKGAERIAYAPIHLMELSQQYNVEKDYSLYTGVGDWLLVGEGMFCLLLPRDIHAPGAMADGESSFVKKVVIKLRVW